MAVSTAEIASASTVVLINESGMGRSAEQLQRKPDHRAEADFERNDAKPKQNALIAEHVLDLTCAPLMSGKRIRPLACSCILPLVRQAAKTTGRREPD
jgi:hypothetical protein